MEPESASKAQESLFKTVPNIVKHTGEPTHHSRKDEFGRLALGLMGVKLVFISDTHESHDWDKQVPAGDVLVHTGDLTMMGRPSELAAFAAKFTGLPHKHKVLIAGNHDLTLDRYLTTVKRQELNERFRSLKGLDTEALRKSFLEGLKDKGVVYLEDEAAEVLGITFYGSPYTPKHYFWGFQKGREMLGEVWAKIPAGVDVLLTQTQLG